MRPMTTMMLALAFALPLAGTGSAPQFRSAPAVPAAAPQDAPATMPPASWLPDDPADSLYREARAALRRSEYTQAARLFSELRAKYPKSGYVADAYYWEAFALYRTGETDRLRRAVALLERQTERYPRASTHSDASALLARVHGELAKRGDQNSVIYINDAVQPPPPPAVPSVNVTERPPRPPRAPAVGRGASSGGDCDDADDTRMMALNALLQMDSERAMPILERVLARRDEGTVCLRRKAVFLLAQKAGDRTTTVLLDVIRNDPDPEVKSSAVFWLSQADASAAVPALDSILRTTNDPELRGKALFSLSQQDSPIARKSLRDIARRTDVPEETRAQAIFWLGQQKASESGEFLRSLYSSANSSELKERILFSVAQSNDPEARQWLLGIAKNQNENVEQRKKALFWFGQKKGSAGELVSLYDQGDREMKEQLIFGFAQSNDKAAIDKLLDIAKNEKDPELRKKAIFWLGQSKDPRAIEVLQSVIEQ